ncbi:adenosylmethionine decarboxylase [Aquirhabdus parva]|nr:adenosylmethionine decarboxylase [Aquirhabdus parva]
MNTGLNTMDGIHLIADLYDCQCPLPLIETLTTLEPCMVTAAKDADMQVVGVRFHQFQPVGVTGVVLLAESHVAVHTWPERAYVTLDVYVCNHTGDNQSKAECLFEALIQLFNPKHAERVQVKRGSRFV